MHSCEGSFDDVYGGSVGRHWKSIFSGLETGARVLDLATGNGALPRLLFQHGAGRELHCDAVDVADVHPPWIDELAQGPRSRLCFHGGVRVEQLPFDDGRFALVCSQYGIEYASREPALRELVRVTQAGGRAVLVMHHVESRPVQVARAELEHLDWLLGSAGLVDATRNMLEPLARAATAEGRASLSGDAAANLARDAFNEAQRTLTGRTQTMAAPDVLFEARDALAECARVAIAQGDSAGVARLEALERQFQDHRFRLLELCQHALDSEQLGLWLAALRSHFGDVVSTRLHEGEHLMAWVLDAQGRQAGMR